MKQVKWNRTLCVGVKQIDEQHKTLIERLNAVASAVAARQGEREIVKSLDFLSEYTLVHFSAEETLMKESAYPEMSQHVAKHDEFKNTLATMEQELNEDGATPLLADAVEKLLVNWLVNHIRSVDRKFGRFLSKKKS
jgi:hemerythrin